MNANKRSGHANPSRSWALDKEQCTFSWRRKERWEQKKEKELLRTPNALKKKNTFRNDRSFVCKKVDLGWIVRIQFK